MTSWLCTCACDTLGFGRRPFPPPTGPDEGMGCGMRGVEEEVEEEVQVREEEGLAFQYPERIKRRALDGGSPQSYTGRVEGEEEGGRRVGEEGGRRKGEEEKRRE